MPRSAQPTLHELQQAAGFRTALRRFLERSDSVAVESGLTRERYDLLLMIKALGAEGQDVRLTDLCEPLQLRQTAVTELVKRAEAVGLVRKTQATDDRRAVTLQLTREGERRLLAAFDALREDREELAQAFAAANRQLRRAAS